MTWLMKTENSEADYLLQRADLGTFYPIELSVRRRADLRTFCPIKLSVRRCVGLETCFPIKLSVRRRVDLGTFSPIKIMSPFPPLLFLYRLE